MRQTRFSEETSAEMETALEQLFAADVTGLIFDLRGNPGGLLSQAAEVADLFLPRGAPIVSVRDRSGRHEETKRSERRPPAAQMPLIVLIDGGSASAAEIVAGAVQDNDRGLVLGTTSFGKGSVQTIFDLRDRDRAALKLTTALYYTPSGRSIHRESLQTPPSMTLQVPFGDLRLPAGLLMSELLTAPDAEAAADRLRARFDLDEALTRQVLDTSLGSLVGRLPATDDSSAAADDAYRTDAGREVFGGGGIEPDIVVESAVPPPQVQELRRHRVFFDFIVEYVGTVNGGDLDTSLTVDDAMLTAFHDFLPRSRANDARRQRLREELHGLRVLADESSWDAGILSHIDSLEVSIERHGQGAPMTDEEKSFIRAQLRRELALRLRGRRASLLVDLTDDPQVVEAVSLLRDPERYERLLAGDSD
jgi:carboxyl-terminal processing protease